MCLTLGLTILASTTEIQRVLYSQYTVGSIVLSAKVSMYRRIALVLCTYLYLHLISSPVDSEVTPGWICNLQKTETPRIV